METITGVTVTANLLTVTIIIDLVSNMVNVRVWMKVHLHLCIG